MIEYEEITEAFDDAVQINVYTEGVKAEYDKGGNIYSNILNVWNGLVRDSRQMPAFGVSLNHETTNAMKNGLWLEFGFGQTCQCWGMPFEKLLIDVRETYTGFNIIRYTSETGYDGRCFYLDLVDKDMSKIHTLLRTI